MALLLIVVAPSRPASAGPRPVLVQAFNPVAPARLLDTRLSGAAVGPGGTVSVAVEVTAPESLVVLNVTAVSPSADTYLTAYASDERRPATAHLNAATGDVVANLVVVRPGPDGVTIYNHAGTVDLVVDVVATGGSIAGFGPPLRLVDTRTGLATFDGQQQGGGPIAPGSTTTIDVGARLGATGTRMVMLTVTMIDPTADTYLTVFTAGSARPPVASAHATAGRTKATTVIVRTSADGRVAVYDHSGRGHLVVDVVQVFSATLFAAEPGPERLADTRTGSATVDGLAAGGGPLGPGESRHLQVGGRTGIPPASQTIGMVAVLVTFVAPTTDTFGGVAAADASGPPTVSSLNVAAGRTVSNLVLVRPSEAGEIVVYNHAGRVDVVVDLMAWWAQGLA